MKVDAIKQRLVAHPWIYGNVDLNANALIMDRLKSVARNRSIIAYSDLVRGIDFKIGSINDGHAIELGNPTWTGLHRKILGEVLGYLSASSYIQHGFMVSALAVERNEFKPSNTFFEWAKWLGLIHSTREDDVLPFWDKHLKAAYKHFQGDPTNEEDT